MGRRSRDPRHQNHFRNSLSFDPNFHGRVLFWAEDDAMKVWLFLEQLKPLRWCIRFGKKWRIVKKVEILVPMKTMAGRKAPHGYLVGNGGVSFKGSTAIIRQGIVKP